MKKLATLMLFLVVTVSSVFAQYNYCDDYNHLFTNSKPYTVSGTDFHDNGSHWGNNVLNRSCTFWGGNQLSDGEYQCLNTAGSSWEWQYPTSIPAGEWNEDGEIYDNLSYQHYVGFNETTQQGQYGVIESTSYGVFAMAVEACRVALPGDPNCTYTSIGFNGLTPVFTPHPGSFGYFVDQIVDSDSNTCPDIVTEFGSPIAFDLEGKDFNDAFTDVEHGVVWTFYPDHPAVRLSWTNPDRNIAWLAYDRDGNGKVKDASYLFGNLTWSPLSEQEQKQILSDKQAGVVLPYKTDGFKALAVWDRPENGGNGDGKLDASDAIWSKLRLCVDHEHNAQMYFKNCQTLEEDGIKSISLSYIPSGRIDQYGNRLKYEGTAEMIDPSSHPVKIYDVYPVFGK